jgi:hypothetical protein
MFIGKSATSLMNPLGFKRSLPFYVRILTDSGHCFFRFIYKRANPNGFIGFEPIIRIITYHLFSGYWYAPHFFFDRLQKRDEFISCFYIFRNDNHIAFFQISVLIFHDKCHRFVQIECIM